ncbi:MAG: radical SAM protein [Methanospirillum sp.]|uniref:radical SAM protein n=1 Tax=Methanospirillum sp. TaxID=45200 RepID=UPI002375252D|nr:radical SAM protein [Methanospirillum sp.]MDD1729016.1 radical SAM protein [Methanospirillum sp.]
MSNTCTFCEIRCTIPDGLSGRCGMYTNLDGQIIERYPDSYLIEYPISIETTPFLHFYPRHTFLQVSTIGCNFRCEGCVSELLTQTVSEFSPSLMHKTPDMIVQKAREESCHGIVFAINEPAVSLPSFLRLAKTAREAGLLIGCSTNGYFSRSSFETLIPYLDTVAVGIKGSSDKEYQMCGAQSPEPVFRTIATLIENNIHVEVTVVHEQGNEESLLRICNRIADISEHIPILVMRFIAFGDAELSMEPGILDSEQICDQIRRRSPYAYLFNSPGSSYLDTRCPRCGSVVVHREFYGPMGARVIHQQDNWVCTCGYHVPYTGTWSRTSYQEKGMMGGYRPTRALEVIKAVTTCLGITDAHTSARVWVDFISHNYIDAIHRNILNIETFYEVITHLATITGKDQEGADLIAYIRERTGYISGLVSGLKKPTVLYAMGTPLFVLNEERFENKMVIAAGGEPLNRDLPRQGKPGIMVEPAYINQMDPEVIIISGFLSTPVEDVYAICEEKGIDVQAVRNRRVYVMPPSWDFGNPRWILGLANLANLLHPDEVHIDMEEEADRFYQKFYHIPYADARPNRSFFRPSSEA